MAHVENPEDQQVAPRKPTGWLPFTIVTALLSAAGAVVTWFATVVVGFASATCENTDQASCAAESQLVFWLPVSAWLGAIAITLAGAVIGMRYWRTPWVGYWVSPVFYFVVLAVAHEMATG